MQPALAKRYSTESPWILTLLAAALVLFVLGIFRPFTVVTKLWLFESEVSVYSSLVTFRDEEEWFLFCVVFIFTVVFPTVKLLTLLAMWLVPGLTRDRLTTMHGFVAHLGRWSMLDVFIVAILVVFIKAGTLADITIADGIVIFTASVVLTQVASALTAKIAAREIE